MKNIGKITAFIIAVMMIMSVTVSAYTLPVEFYDPMAYEAPLKDYINKNGVMGGENGEYRMYDINWVQSAGIQASYVEEATPVSSGYLHKDANAGQFYVNTGDASLNSFANYGSIPARANMPGSLGKSKTEVVFRINNAGGVAALSDDSFSFRNFYVKSDGSQGVVGYKGGVINNNTLSWAARLEGGDTDISGTNNGDKNVQSDALIHFGNWYRFTTAFNLPINQMFYLVEVYNEANDTWETIRKLDDPRKSSDFDIQYVASGIRVQFNTAFDVDIAQIKITRDRYSLINCDPAATPLTERTALNEGWVTNFSGGADTNTLVARTYAATNEVGKDATGAADKYYINEYGITENNGNSPLMLIVQYDSEGKILKIDQNQVNIGTLNAGYRGDAHVYMDPTLELAPVVDDYDYEILMQKELDWKMLEIKAPKQVGVAKAGIYLWGDIGSLNPVLEGKVQAVTINNAE